MAELHPVWLVEDSEQDIELMLAAFDQFHLANPVVVLRDGGEVLSQLHQLLESPPSCDPAVVFLDIRMPKLNGIEVLRTIKLDGRFRHLPVVMLTASDQGCDVADCLELGADAYVVKPIDMASFFAVVNTAEKMWAIVDRPQKLSGVLEKHDEIFTYGKA